MWHSCPISVHLSPSRVLGPPMSLQELLERQWEQTAQFIIHQAGQQNNGRFICLSVSRCMELVGQSGPYSALILARQGGWVPNCHIADDI